MKQSKHEELEITSEMLFDMYKVMLLARAFDERASILVKQGEIPFTVTGVGHEAAHVGAAMALKKGYDVVFPYYRDVALVMALGMTPLELMLAEYARASDPNSGGRQMPKHFSSPKLNIITQSSPVGTQITQATGVGLAIKIKKEDKVSFVSFGDGAVSKGDFHEGLNFAAIHKLPVIYFCENNLYAISVPFEKQSAVENVADRAAAYDIPGVNVDGNDGLAVFKACKEAVTRARKGEGPTLIEARTYRFDPHTSNDDDRKYRSQEEVKSWRSKDPIDIFASYLKDNKILDDKKDSKLKNSVKEDILEAVERAKNAPPPKGHTALRYVYNEEENR